MEGTAPSVLHGSDGALPSTHLSEPETQIANRPAPIALFQFAQDFRFVHAVQLVMERRLEDVHVENPLAQRDRAGLRRDEFANKRFPRAEDFGFLHPLL